MRKLTITVWLGIIGVVVALTFWNTEWKYKLPTPVPVGYHPVPRGERIVLPSNVLTTPGRPRFLHFFNPDCPCSRFNIAHFKTLVARYHNDVDFSVVVVSDKHFDAEKIQRKFGLDVPVIFDTALATMCGVYSTPQAVLITAGNELYYRGNYNRSRYCTDEKSNYAQIALSSLIGHSPYPRFDQLALTSYGCELPLNNYPE